MGLGFVPIIMVVMNLVYAVFAYPAGVLADRMHPRALLLCGIAQLVLADVILALASTPWHTFLGAGVWDLHMAFTQGLFSKLVANASPAELRGTAFGVFNLVSGGAVLVASVVAGSLWSAFGPAATFHAGAGFASIAALGLLVSPLSNPIQDSDSL